MRKSLVLVVGGAALLAASAVTYAFVTRPGIVLPAAPPANPALFGVTVVINPGPVATGGQGDTIVSVHEGRDIRSPYVAIEWIPNMAMHQPATQALLMTCPGNPLGTAVPAMSPNPANPTIWFVYRPTNDPVNPGWVAPAAPSQFEAAVVACHVFADSVRQAIKFQNEQDNAALGTPIFYAPPPPPVAFPNSYVAEISMEVDFGPGSPTLGEFITYDVTTR